MGRSRKPLIDENSVRGFESHFLRKYGSVAQDASEHVKTDNVVSINDLKYGFVSLRMHRKEHDSK